MPIKFSLVISKSGNSLRVTIPTTVLENLNLKRHDHVWLWVEGKQIVIEKKKVLPK